MIVGMALINPIKTLTTVNTYFQGLEEDGVPIDLRVAKLTFVALNLLGFLMALYKCSTSLFLFLLVFLFLVKIQTQRRRN